MSISTSILIPINSSLSVRQIADALINPMIFEAYTEVRAVRKENYKVLGLFTKTRLIEYVQSKGKKPENIASSIENVFKQKDDYASLGLLADEVYNELIESLKSVGDIGNWQPGEVSIERPCEGEWGESVISIDKLCLNISGYGNPIGSGSIYAKAIFSSGIFSSLIKTIGCVIDGVHDSDCVITYNGKTILMNLSC